MVTRPLSRAAHGLAAALALPSFLMLAGCAAPRSDHAMACLAQGRAAHHAPPASDLAYEPATFVAACADAGAGAPRTDRHARMPRGPLPFDEAFVTPTAGDYWADRAPPRFAATRCDAGIATARAPVDASPQGAPCA